LGPKLDLIVFGSWVAACIQPPESKVIASRAARIVKLNPSRAVAIVRQDFIDYDIAVGDTAIGLETLRCKLTCKQCG
jgi:hypothetical protein